MYIFSYFYSIGPWHSSLDAHPIWRVWKGDGVMLRCVQRLGWWIWQAARNAAGLGEEEERGASSNGVACQPCTQASSVSSWSHEEVSWLICWSWCSASLFPLCKVWCWWLLQNADADFLFMGSGGKLWGDLTVHNIGFMGAFFSFVVLLTSSWHYSLPGC